MTTQLAKWGNSLALRIPRTVAAELNVQDGDTVEISVHEGVIIVRPAVRRYTIEELVADITPERRHPETKWGPRVGKEAW